MAKDQHGLRARMERLYTTYTERYPSILFIEIPEILFHFAIQAVNFSFLHLALLLLSHLTRQLSDQQQSTKKHPLLFQSYFVMIEVLLVLKDTERAEQGL